MWNPLKRKPLLSDEDLYFQVETYKWLLTHFGGKYFYDETILVLPTKEFFPAEVNSNDEAIQSTFEQVKKYAGMSEWPCKLEAQEEDPNLVVAPTLVLQNVEQNPLGTFAHNENNEVTITYNPKIASNPTQMVATFAHELSHYLTGTAPEPPPGGWDNWEFATDICAAFLGFGVFVANAAFDFQQYTSVGTHGWQTSGGGYLSEAEYSYALAIFLMLKNLSYKDAYKHCGQNIKNFLKQAIDELEKNSLIEELCKVKHVPIND